MLLDKRSALNFEWPLAAAVLALCGMGLVILYSAGFDPETQMSVPMKRQAAAMGVGWAAFLAIGFLSVNFWKRWAFILFGFGCLLLAIIDTVGIAAGGARRWLDLGGGVRMQPSEFMKIGVILLCARLFSSDRVPQGGYNLRTLVFPGFLLAIPCSLTLIQPDLGTAMCQALIGGSMLFLAGVTKRTVAIVLIVLGIAAVPAWHSLHEYQQKRIYTFLSPESDPLGSGYHAMQSKIAVGSGAMTGKGFLKGTQTQLRFLPEQTTDFLFSVLAEEWGFFGSASALALYAFIIYRILRICARTEDRFQAYVCFGVASMVFWHVLINIGMVTGVVPVVGITLPLLSYGGSSVVTQMVAFGLVARISAKRYLFA